MTTIDYDPLIDALNAAGLALKLLPTSECPVEAVTDLARQNPQPVTDALREYIATGRGNVAAIVASYSSKLTRKSAAVDTK